MKYIIIIQKTLKDVDEVICFYENWLLTIDNHDLKNMVSIFILFENIFIVINIIHIFRTTQTKKLLN